MSGMDWTGIDVGRVIRRVRITQRDDNKILKWSGDGEFLGEAFEFNTAPNVFITELQWAPSAPGRGQTQTSDTMILGTTDGKYYICSKNGKIEKTIEAHNGALLCAQWNFEGSAICTGNFKKYKMSQGEKMAS